MQQLCPISDKQVNELVSRINSFFTVIILLVHLQFHALGLLIFLVFDMLMRGFFDGRYSVLNSLSRQLINVVKKEGRMINAGPKIFAAQVGFFFSLGVLVSSLLGYEWLSRVIAFVFLACALLESLFAYCVACKLYPFFRPRS